MNLHITPSFNIDRLSKTASVLLFLVNFPSSSTLFKLNQAIQIPKNLTGNVLRFPFNPKPSFE